MYRIDAIKLESEKIALRAQMMRPAAKVQQEKPPAQKKTLNLMKRKPSDSSSKVNQPRGKRMKFTKEVAAKQQEEVKDD